MNIEKIKQLFEAVGKCFRDYKPLYEGSTLLIEGDIAEGIPVVEQIEGGTFRPAPDQEVEVDGNTIVIKDGVISKFACGSKDNNEDIVDEVVEEVIEEAIKKSASDDPSTDEGTNVPEKCEDASGTIETPSEPTEPTFVISQDMWDAIQSEISALKDQVNAIAPKVESVASEKTEGKDAMRKILGKLSSI